jgi:RNA-dependent RNA polymerase
VASFAMTLSFFGNTPLVLLKQLENIKYKSRIYVEDSPVLWGIIDEKQLLKPGEVYIQIDSVDVHKAIEGKVIVTKNPCFYPGDIRCYNTVNREELDCYKNVIVFPQWGVRPLQQLLSNGELDRDSYFVCWEDCSVSNFIDHKLPSIEYHE